MAFFDVPRDEDISPEASQWLDELKRLRGVDTLPRSWVTYAALSADPQGPRDRRSEPVQAIGTVGVLLGGPGDRLHGRRLMNMIFTTVANTALRED